jgi:hypothetical protein
MALTASLSAAAKAALAARAVDPSSALFQVKYILFVDSAATPVRFVANATTPTAAANVATVVATGTCPVGVTTPIGATTGVGDTSTANTVALLIGDVGAYSIASKADADTLAAGAWATLANYVIATVTGTGADGDVIAVTAADDVKCTGLTITW